MPEKDFSGGRRGSRRDVKGGQRTVVGPGVSAKTLYWIRKMREKETQKTKGDGVHECLTKVEGRPRGRGKGREGT